jgi:hypothetical protein
MDIIIAQVIWGAIGFSYLMYARKQKKSAPLVVGIIIIGLTYVVPNFWIISAINISLMFYPKFIKGED